MDRHLARLLKPALVVLCLLVTGCASDDPSAVSYTHLTLPTNREV